MDIIGKDKLDSIFGRFVGDVHPKWTPPSESHSCSSSYVAPGTLKLCTVFLEYVPYFSTSLPCGRPSKRKARRNEKRPSDRAARCTGTPELGVPHVLLTTTKYTNPQH